MKETSYTGSNPVGTTRKITHLPLPATALLMVTTPLDSLSRARSQCDRDAGDDDSPPPSCRVFRSKSRSLRFLNRRSSCPGGYPPWAETIRRGGAIGKSPNGLPYLIEIGPTETDSVVPGCLS